MADRLSKLLLAETDGIAQRIADYAKSGGAPAKCSEHRISAAVWRLRGRLRTRVCGSSTRPWPMHTGADRRRGRPPPGLSRVAAACVQLSGPPLENIQGPEPPYEPTYIRGDAVVVSKTGARGRRSEERRGG